MIILVGFITLFAIIVGSMYLYPYDSVQIPSACDNAAMIGSNNTARGNLIQTSFLITQSETTMPLHFISPDFNMPKLGKGVLLTSDAKSAVVVMVDFNNSNFNSTLYLLSKSDNSTIAEMSFSNDFLAATIRNNVLYIYNGGLGYFLNPNSGESVNKIFSIDNYRDVSVTGDSAIIQTTAIIAGLYADGSFFNEPNLNFNAMAYGCLIS